MAKKVAKKDVKKRPVRKPDDQSEPIFTVGMLLSDAIAMDGFIRTLQQNGLTNRDGAAHRQIRHVYFEAGIVLQSDDHPSSHCSIKICSEPDADVQPGSTDARRMNGSANPRPSKGRLVLVWRNGQWTKGGPWQEKIEELLKRLLKKLVAAVKSNAKRKKSDDEEKAGQAATDEEDLVAKWS